MHCMVSSSNTAQNNTGPILWPFWPVVSPVHNLTPWGFALSSFIFWIMDFERHWALRVYVSGTGNWRLYVNVVRYGWLYGGIH
jgi:hypothetical protein